MIKDKLDKVIRTIPNFPKKGISFKDITPLLLDFNLTNDIIDAFIQRLNGVEVDAIVGVESRGFLFGFLLANKMELPFIPIRKVGRLPGETIKYKYDLEYGSAEIEIHKQDVKEGWNILVHDDLLATGGTACAAAELVFQLNATVSAFTFVVNLDFLNGKKELKKYSNNIISLTDF
ncbi:MAG: adenine phosphoribosyltransferase [Flavobacteriales bacterium]|jgi:adenine phosphoribosyltransferase|nr:adenine phosphoribosyltransferase [Flavobacteriales bacterium]